MAAMRSVTLAVDAPVLEEIERLREATAKRSGVRVPRSEMLRVCIERGVAALNIEASERQETRT